MYANQQQQQQQQQLMAAATAQQAAQSKRKEKARIAARARRSQEAGIIMEMAVELHISQERLRRIDKATIVKLAIDYIKAHDMLRNIERELSVRSDQQPQPNEQPQLLTASAISKALPSARTSPKSREQDERAQSDDEDFAGAVVARRPCETLSDHLRHQHHHHRHHHHNRQHIHQDPERKNSNLGEIRATNAAAPAAMATTTTTTTTTTPMPTPSPMPTVTVKQQQADERAASPLERHSRQLRPAPKLTTTSIFAPKTRANSNPYFLMIEARDNGKASFVLKPDTEIHDEDDLTHLAPQAGDISISFETDPLEGIPLDDLLVPSPSSSSSSSSPSSSSSSSCSSMSPQRFLPAGCPYNPFVELNYEPVSSFLETARFRPATLSS